MWCSKVLKKYQVAASEAPEKLIELLKYYSDSHYLAEADLNKWVKTKPSDFNSFDKGMQYKTLYRGVALGKEELKKFKTSKVLTPRRLSGSRTIAAFDSWTADKDFALAWLSEAWDDDYSWSAMVFRIDMPEKLRLICLPCSKIGERDDEHEVLCKSFPLKWGQLIHLETWKGEGGQWDQRFENKSATKII